MIHKIEFRETRLLVGCGHKRMIMQAISWKVCAPLVWVLASCGSSVALGGEALSRPFHEAELIFPLEAWHNHASTVVETPAGDLLVCWFHGSGERTADDVKIEGARLRRGSRAWSERFLMADTPGYPDTNCTMFIDPEGPLWRSAETR